MKEFNLFRYKKRFLMFFFFTTLLIVASTYEVAANSNLTFEEQRTKPIEPSFNLNALPFPEEKIIRVAIYNEPNFTETLYTGGNSGVETNNVSKVVELLSVKPNIEIDILTEAHISNHILTTANFDVLIIPDVHPRDWIVDMIQDFWLGGGGILTLDGAALFLNYFGILPPESSGSNGYSTYWTYSGDGFNFTIRHPAAKAYAVDAYVEPPGGYGHFGWDWSALSGSVIAGDLYPFAHDFTNPNIITGLAFDPSDRGGRIVTIGHDLTNNYNPDIDALVIDSVSWLAPKPKGRILFDLSHNPFYSVDSWDNVTTSWTGKYTTMRNSLVARDFTFDKLYSTPSGDNITLPRLAPYDMLIIVAPQYQNNFTPAEINAIETWVADGGSLLVAGDNPNSLSDEVAIINDLMNPFDLTINMGNNVQTTYNGLVPHPISEETAAGIEYTNNGYINITGSAYGIWYDASFSNIVVAGNEYGLGRVILTGDINWFDDTYITGASNDQIIINIANWLTASQANVLVYTDWGFASNDYLNPVILALNDLGIKHHLTQNFEYFNLTLYEQQWDMVIIANPASGSLDTYFDDVIDYIDAGGHLILSTYIMDDHSTNPIWARLGTEFNSDYTVNPDLYIWDTEHPIFTQPHEHAEPKYVINAGYLDDGDSVTVLSNATALAGSTISETASESFITIRNDEQTLFNSFLIDEFSGDYDDSTYADNYELWKNEIAFMMRPKLDLAINVPLDNFVGDLVDLTAEITNVGLTDCPIGYMELALAPDVNTTDTLEQNYSLAVSDSEILTWTITSDVVQNVTISFEGSYTGFFGTEYGTGVLNFDINFLERPSNALDLPWYYYVAAGGGLLLIILIIIIAVAANKRKKRKIATR